MMAGKPGHQATTRSIETHHSASDFACRFDGAFSSNIALTNIIGSQNSIGMSLLLATVRARIAPKTPVLTNITRRRGRGFRVPRRKILNHFWFSEVEPALAESITRGAQFHAALRSSSALLASTQNRWIEPSSSCRRQRPVSGR